MRGYFVTIFIFDGVTRKNKITVSIRLEELFWSPMLTCYLDSKQTYTYVQNNSSEGRFSYRMVNFGVLSFCCCLTNWVDLFRANYKYLHSVLHTKYYFFCFQHNYSFSIYMMKIIMGWVFDEDLDGYRGKNCLDIGYLWC